MYGTKMTTRTAALIQKLIVDISGQSYHIQVTNNTQQLSPSNTHVIRPEIYMTNNT